jgi:hypothetical protein
MRHYTATGQYVSEERQHMMRRLGVTRKRYRKLQKKWRRQNKGENQNHAHQRTV